MPDKTSPRMGKKKWWKMTTLISQNYVKLGDIVPILSSSPLVSLLSFRPLLFVWKRTKLQIITTSLWTSSSPIGLVLLTYLIYNIILSVWWIREARTLKLDFLHIAVFILWEIFFHFVLSDNIRASKLVTSNNELLIKMRDLTSHFVAREGMEPTAFLSFVAASFRMEKMHL